MQTISAIKITTATIAAIAYKLKIQYNKRIIKRVKVEGFKTYHLYRRRLCESHIHLQSKRTQLIRNNERHAVLSYDFALI